MEDNIKIFTHQDSRMEVASGKHLEEAGVNNEFSADPDINELAKPMSMPSISL
jgi:hypothetical protein